MHGSTTGVLLLLGLIWYGSVFIIAFPGKVLVHWQMVIGFAGSMPSTESSIVAESRKFVLDRLFLLCRVEQSEYVITKSCFRPDSLYNAYF